MNTEQALRERAEAILRQHVEFASNTKILDDEWEYAKNESDESPLVNASISAMIDFHKQELSGKEIYEAVSVEDELPEAEDKVICFRGTERLTFSWPAREFKDLKVTHWLKKLTL